MSIQHCNKLSHYNYCSDILNVLCEDDWVLNFVKIISFFFYLISHNNVTPDRYNLYFTVINLFLF